MLEAYLDFFARMVGQKAYFQGATGIIEAELGAQFGYKLQYKVVGSSTSPTFDYVKLPSYVQSLGDSVTGTAPKASGVDTMVVVLKLGSTAYDTLTVEILINQKPQLGLEQGMARADAARFGVFPVRAGRSLQFMQ